MKFQTAVYSIPCRTINCGRGSKYALHADNEPLTVAEHICPDCAAKLVQSIPDELLYLLTDRFVAAGFKPPTAQNVAVAVKAEAIEVLTEAEVIPPEEVLATLEAGGAPEAVEHVERCVCGAEFTGKTAKAKLGTHKRNCEAAKQEG